MGNGGQTDPTARPPKWKIRTMCGCAAADNGEIDYCRMHATAPALLEALEMLVDDSAVIMPIELIHHFGASLNKARAAIALAKGESNG